MERLSIRYSSKYSLIVVLNDGMLSDLNLLCVDLIWLMYRTWKVKELNGADFLPWICPWECEINKAPRGIRHYLFCGMNACQVLQARPDGCLFLIRNPVIINTRNDISAHVARWRDEATEPSLFEAKLKLISIQAFLLFITDRFISYGWILHD